MELITFLLFIGGNLLFKAILLFIMAIPSGMGLGIGLHIVKSFFNRRARKKIQSPEERANEFINMETATAGASV